MQTSHAYWEPKAECMPRPELEQLQLERLQAALTRAAGNVPFYRRTFDSLGLDPDDIRTREDFSRLPFTTKADLRDNYPYGLFAVPMREVVRLQASSGTTGKPVVTGYTKNDVRRWSSLVARVLTAAGVTRDDLVQIAFAYGLFTGGFGFHYGAEALGAAVIPASSGNTRRQIAILQDYRATALICTPSYALHLADTMQEQGINLNSLALKLGLFGGETWSEATRRTIQERLKVFATDNYGLSEVMGPGVAGECREQCGMHVNEDHFLAEVVDPATGQPLPAGQLGELVLTSLTKEAFPVIRYRTGDLTRLLPGECACGRSFVRMERVAGRTDDMLIIRGVNAFPSQIGDVLEAVEGATPHFQVILDREGSLDQATVLVEATEAIFFDQMRVQQTLIRTIEKALASELGVSFVVKLVDPKSVAAQAEAGKVQRVVDRRRV